MSENAGTGMADKLAGVLITAGLVGCGFAGLALVQTWFEQRDAAILRTIPDVLVTWREGGDTFLPMMLIAIAPLILLPGAFGLSRGMPPVTRRARWMLVAVTAALVATGVAWGGIAGRQEVGVATPFGAAWLYDGKAREHWSWGTATSVGIGCTNQKDETTGKVEPKLNYDVAFPSGREANLARETGDMKTLTARLAVIDANLRARGVARFVSTDAGCVAYYGRGLAEADVVRLRGVLGR
ncbi:hypothetical protein [Caulobacter sp.]|uniref:hypothetical protein n=1 Tax=Caulobacter sp. TaxID=78 RepID=UPI001B2EF431|nr:hypothetical protein [Caulobacter sp.]MBO9543618.1 hypothetical protein [Caulobacter sp.]